MYYKTLKFKLKYVEGNKQSSTKIEINKLRFITIKQYSDALKLTQNKLFKDTFKSNTLAYAHILNELIYKGYTEEINFKYLKKLDYHLVKLLSYLPKIRFKFFKNIQEKKYLKKKTIERVEQVLLADNFLATNKETTNTEFGLFLYAITLFENPKEEEVYRKYRELLSHNYWAYSNKITFFLSSFLKLKKK